MHIRINGVAIETASGLTVLEAARKAGVEIPSLCYDPAIGPVTSCMLCVVWDNASRRLFPSCSAPVVDGMDIETDNEEVHAARRNVLELLLREHVGDCEGPCARICPASLTIPRMLRHVEAGEWDEAARLVKEALIFPAVLGRICTAPCEKGCRRGAYDGPVKIRRLHGEAAERALAKPGQPITSKPDSGKRVAVIGAGLTGLAAAWTCRMHGHECHVYETSAQACPELRGIDPEVLPGPLLDEEIKTISDAGVVVAVNCEFNASILQSTILPAYNVVILTRPINDIPDARPVFRVDEESMPVRAVAKGKAIARQVNAFLLGQPEANAPHRFHSRVGTVHAEELAAYAVGRIKSQDASAPRSLEGEAARCLHCDCLRPVSCKLRQYAEQYGATQSAGKSHAIRPPIMPIQTAGDIVYEPGKCIRCGLCVETAARAGHAAGLAFAGRGRDMHMEAAFGAPLAEGLGDAGPACVAVCPTGALAYRAAGELP